MWRLSVDVMFLMFEKGIYILAHLLKYVFENCELVFIFLNETQVS